MKNCIVSAKACGDTLIVFYQDLSSQYQYTDIGRINNPEGLMDTLGSADIQISVY